MPVSRKRKKKARTPENFDALNAALHAARTRDPRFRRLAANVPSKHVPLMVERMFDERIYGTAQWFAGALTLAWRKVEVPTLRVRPDKWISMFRTLGFVTYGDVNGVVDESKRPTEPLTLYRGAPPEYRAGLSWTDTPERARWYVQEWETGKRNTGGTVWKCIIPPERFLGYFDRDPVEEIEWVADVRGLPIVEHIPADREIVRPRVAAPSGRVVIDPRSGREWFVKTPPTIAHARNEYAANQLYALAGVPVPDAQLSPDGTRYMSAMLDAQPWTESTPEVRRHFVVDAWLANWDAPEPGNILIGGDGTAYRVDTGGALDFRARGERRNLTPEVWELETMRDPGISPAGAKLYAGLTAEEEADALGRIMALDESEIRAAITAAGVPARVGDVLLTRREFLASRYGVPAG
ncbi:hypothetical protein ACWEQD_18150 [Rhodococcus pyridinivorans]